MTGTLVNTGAVLAGSLIGLLLKKGIRSNIEHSVHQALGLATLMLGINGVVSSMFTVSDGKLSSDGTLLLIISLVVGVIVGELLRIDDRLNHLGDKIGEKFKVGNFSAGFVNATLIFCVGAMTIVGSINDGMLGDPSILLVKSLLDFIASIVLAATMGVGVIFSAVGVLAYQGALTLMAGFIGPYISPLLLDQICMVGYVLVMCIGINFLEMTEIKTANFLPGLLVPVIWVGLQSLWSMVIQ